MPVFKVVPSAWVLDATPANRAAESDCVAPVRVEVRSLTMPVIIAAWSLGATAEMFWAFCWS